MSITLDTRLDVLKKIVDKLQRKDEIKNYKQYIDIYDKTLDIIKQKQLILYGGFALNKLLPKVHRIYKDKSLPDIDCFSNTARKDAMEIAQVLKDNGFNYVEVKSGIHKGTYKIFVEFQPIADITNLTKSMYSYLSKNALLVDNIMICPADFLLWSFYKELSRPEGSSFRWEKIYKRYGIFHKHFKFKERTPIYNIDIDDIEYTELFNNIQKIIKKNKYIVIGHHAVGLYLDKPCQSSDKMYMFDILSENIDETYKVLKDELNLDIKLTLYNKSLYEVSSHIGSLIYEQPDGKIIKLCKIYKTDACYSYQKISGYHVGSIDTVLCFLYSQYMTSAHYNTHDGKLTKALRTLIVSLESNVNDMNTTDRFKTNCLGYEQTMIDIRKDNWDQRGFMFRP